MLKELFKRPLPFVIRPLIQRNFNVAEDKTNAYEMKRIKRLNTLKKDFISNILNKKKTGDETITYFCDFLTDHYGSLGAPEIISTTKGKLLESLQSPSISPLLGANLIYVILKYLKNLKKRCPFWRFEIKNEDFYNELDTYLIQNLEHLNTQAIVRLLENMATVNYQNKRLLTHMIPYILQDKNIRLKEISKVYFSMYNTEMVKDQEIIKRCREIVESREAVEQVKKYCVADITEILLNLVRVRVYPKKLFMKSISILEKIKRDDKFNFKIYTICNFLQYVDHGLHTIPLNSYASLKENYEKLYTFAYLNKRSNFISCWEKQVTPLIIEDAKKLEGAVVKLQRLVNGFTIDVVLEVPGKKPYAIDISKYKEFRNDILDNTLTLKNRWLNYKGYVNCILNDEIQDIVLKKNKGLVKGMIEYFDEIYGKKC